MMYSTNTIHVVLSPGESLHAATSAFRQFGDVSSLELLPGDVLMASVVFFDVRAAAQALETLGFAVAQPAPQTGSRIALMKADSHLKADDIGNVSNVFVDATSSEGTFAVEFYDIRDALRAKELAEEEETLPEDHSEKALKVIGAPPGLESFSTCSEPQPVPVYVIPSAAALPAAVVAPATVVKASAPAPVAQPAAPPPQDLQPAHFTVRITGIPNPLLSHPCFEAILQQAGLLSATIHFKTELGQREQQSGDALVTFLSCAMAQQCISHFLGRQWNTSGGEVSAWLEPTDSAAPGEWGSPGTAATEDEVRKRCDSSNTAASTATGPGSDAEEEREADAPRTR
uniref:Uncharacterized protein n=1 Tax=Alexandrium monilatum TaxID=311494 RepID=A0A7S4QDM8_9DINO